MTRPPAVRLAEAEGLASAIRLDVVHSLTVGIRRIRPSALLGKGKLEELAAVVKAADVELIIADCALSPIQQRNLERELSAKVIDRTCLILEIFGERARTREGTLQVELAHLNYQKSRLVRSWTHLERQRGGFGFLGGPGETQIETDRRLISERIGKIKRQLETVTRTRALHRQSRRRVPYPVVALVGYTNAGKSTLFNRLTDAEVSAADQLFETLDPTMRELVLPSGRRVMLSDTVGFISDLPTQLIAAFRATLEEVIEADIILHVRDVAHPDSGAQRYDVEKVLTELGVDESDDRPIIEALNKIDLLDDSGRNTIINRAHRQTLTTPISAATGEGVSQILAAVDEILARSRQAVDVTIEHGDSAAIAWLYRHGEVIERVDDDHATRLKVLLSPANLGRFRKQGAPAQAPDS